MRSKSNTIETDSSIDDVIYAFNNELDYTVSVKLAKKFVKNNITKEKLENYLEEKEFDGFGRGHEFNSCTELAAEYLYDYARFFDDYDDAVDEIYKMAVSRFPKSELLNALEIMGVNNVPKNADMYTIREIAVDEFSKLYSDDYTLHDMLDDDIINEIESVFNKYFFEN